MEDVYAPQDPLSSSNDRTDVEEHVSAGDTFCNKGPYPDPATQTSFSTKKIPWLSVVTGGQKGASYLSPSGTPFIGPAGTVFLRSHGRQTLSKVTDGEARKLL